MNLIIKKIVPNLPEDIIRLITSYLITKIPKSDQRYEILDKHILVMNSKRRKQDLFHTDDSNEYIGYIIHFPNKHFLFMGIIPDKFILYQYQNSYTNEITSDRCWFKLENMYQITNNYWERYVMDKWIPNPNTSLIGNPSQSPLT